MTALTANRRGRGRIDDSWLYDADAVLVGVLLFGARLCTACGLPLPACTDYFTSNRPDGLKPICKRCVAARYREADKERRQRQRDKAQVERLVRGLCARTARLLERGIVRP